MRKGKVFNTFKRPKLLRKHISPGEAATGVGLLLLLVLCALWLRGQRLNYDPGERDIAFSLLPTTLRQRLKLSRKGPPRKHAQQKGS